MIAALALALITAPDALLALPPGTPQAAAERALAGARWLDKRTDGALAEGLVKSRLLETLNRLELAPRDGTRALDASAFDRVALLERGDRRYVAAFGAGGGLRYLLVRISVPVDRDDPGERRLHRLRDALAELERAGFALKPHVKDRYGNVFVWAGRGRGSVRALYLPEEDELRVLIFQ